MGSEHKADNKADELKRQGKEALGKATADSEMTTEGKGDQARTRSSRPARGQARRREVKHAFR